MNQWSKPKQRLASQEVAYRLLAAREHSRAELARKLATRGFEQQEIETLLDQLVEANLQSDQRYCEAFIRSKINRHQGPLKIRHALKEAGVSSQFIESSLLDYDEEFWWQHLQNTWAKKFAAPASSQQDLMRQQRFLLQKGFATGMVSKWLLSQ